MPHSASLVELPAWPALARSARLGIKLWHLPPYSPNLNLIERAWKVMNEEVRNNVYFPDAKTFTSTDLPAFWAVPASFFCLKPRLIRLACRILQVPHSVHLFVLWTLCLPLERRIQDDFASCLPMNLVEHFQL